MEKTLSIGNFMELDVLEAMETKGGSIQEFFNLICGATAAEKAAEQAYNAQRNALINQMKQSPEIVTSIPKASYEYFNLPDGGYKSHWM